MSRARIVQWGPLPPPVGGVAMCVQGIADWWSSRGESEVVDVHRRATLKPSVLAAMRDRDTISIAHISTVRGMVVYAAIFRGATGRSVAFFHGGSFAQTLGDAAPRSTRLVASRLLGVFSEVWATSAPVARVIEDLAKPRVQVVSPYVADARPMSIDPAARRRVATVASWSGRSVYGVPLAVEAVRILRERGLDWTLEVLLYGHRTTDAVDLEREMGDHEFVQVLTGLSNREMLSYLQTVEVLMRPTTSDGDSLLVRQAIDAGARVIASPAAPRPIGVELAGLDAVSIVDAVLNGGVPSDGVGLGPPCTGELQRLLGC